jgi:alpha-L-fucosidase
MGFNWNKNPGAEVWASNGTFTLDQRHQPKAIPPKPANHDIIWRDLFHRRVEELLTRYGRLDLLWFDGGPIDNPLRDRARKLQPHLVINSRSCDGDYDCTECTLPDKPPPAGCWFETCDCWQDSGILSPWKNEDVGVWGYLARERYKSTAWMLERLARLRAWGSNYLINVGPRPDGELPRVVYERFAETAAWMKHSRASVIGASGCPKDLHCNAPVTCDSGHIYVHVLPGIKGEITLDPVKRPQSVRLMRTGANLSSSYNDRALRFSIPSDQRTDLVDVVVLEHQDRLI